MKRLLAVLCLLCIIIGLAGCNTNSDDNTNLFQTPNFEEPPVAAGTTVQTDVNTMLSQVNGFKTIRFSFAEMLANSKQTLYDINSTKAGTVLEENITPLNEISAHLNLIDFTSLLPIKVEDFKMGDHDKMAYLQNESFSKIYQNGVLTDFCFDLTTKTLIIRLINVTSTTTSSSTTYITIEVYMGNKEAYSTSVRMEEYGDNNGTEFVIISNSLLSFTVQDGELINGMFEQTRDTSISEQAVIEDVNGLHMKEKTSAERVEFKAQVRMIDKHYDVIRETVLYQAENTRRPDDAKEVYRATQNIQWIDTKYKLTETAEGVSTDGQPLKTEQYVIFEEKESNKS